jgi:hypothetical protein
VGKTAGGRGGGCELDNAFSLRKFVVCSNKFIYLGISLLTLEIKN